MLICSIYVLLTTLSWTIVKSIAWPKGHRSALIKARHNDTHDRLATFPSIDMDAENVPRIPSTNISRSSTPATTSTPAIAPSPSPSADPPSSPSPTIPPTSESIQQEAYERVIKMTPHQFIDVMVARYGPVETKFIVDAAMFFKRNPERAAKKYLGLSPHNDW